VRFLTDECLTVETVSTAATGAAPSAFGLFPSEVREFKGHAAFRRMPVTWEF
jgi:hypothetical protein